MSIVEELTCQLLVHVGHSKLKVLNTADIVFTPNTCWLLLLSDKSNISTLMQHVFRASPNHRNLGEFNVIYRETQNFFITRTMLWH